MQLPISDPQRLAKKPAVVKALQKCIPSERVLHEPAQLVAYRCDGLFTVQQTPMAVVQPTSTQEVAAILRTLSQMEVPVVPWGAGTGLSGGAFPLEDGVTMALSRMNCILEIDYENRCAVLQPGVTNLSITHAVQAQGFYYAPDPSSQIACSIGGNVAENAGGIHCLKYGVTTNNILGVELVLADGTILRLGGKNLDSAGYDLLGLITGSEGLLGIITEVTVKLLRRPQSVHAMLAAFHSVEEAGQAVADIIATGIVPAAMEIMDRLTIQATADFAKASYPSDAEAILLLELDGQTSEVNHWITPVRDVLNAAGAANIEVASDETERARLWAGRKAAFPAMGRISPDYYCIDGSIPRSKLGEVLNKIRDLSTEHGLRVANVFHAGDGNLHPLVLYDSGKPDEMQRAEALGDAILRLCIEVGGVLSGEHGVGVEKRALMTEQFTEHDLDTMQRVKCSFDPNAQLNPGKMFPVLRRCAELGRVHVHHGQLPHPELERF